MVKAVIFDFWGTLADNGVRSPLKQVMEMLHLYNLDFSEFVAKFESVFMTKKHDSLEDAFSAVCKTFNIKPNPYLMNDLIGMWNKNWMLAKLYADTVEGLETLKADGYKIALLSNTDNFSVEKVMEKFDLAKHFDAIVFSFECGLLKADPKMFELALEKLGVDKDEAVMVGDSVESDIEGAKRAGIKAFLMDRRDKRSYEDKVITIESLRERLKSLYSCGQKKRI